MDVSFSAWRKSVTAKGLVSKIKKCQGKAREFLNKRDELLKELRAICKHANITEWNTSHHDDWDRITTYYYTRKCLCCGLEERCTTESYNYGQPSPKEFYTLLHVNLSGKLKAEVEE